MQAFVPKNRRPKFETQLRIVDLSNVPLVSGTTFVKWHLPHSAAAEHRGRTSKSAIKDHKVTYNYEKIIPIRLTINKNTSLQDIFIQLDVIQEYASSGKGEKIVLGTLKLNLAEYVHASETEGQDAVMRRHLMQESKINSTLKVGIFMKQVDGDRNYNAPPLKSAPVFGGITGVVSSEKVEADDVGSVPNLNVRSRELAELQDMYRRALAASWAAQPGELQADECIEDIFVGGDGMGNVERKFDTFKRRGSSSRGLASDQQITRKHRNGSSLSFFQGTSKSIGMDTLEDHTALYRSQNDLEKNGKQFVVDELDYRDNLCSWVISTKSGG